MRRRLVFHVDYDEKFDYHDLPAVIDKARFKGEIVVSQLGRKQCVTTRGSSKTSST